MSQRGRVRVARLRLSAIRMDFQPAENLIEETVQMYVDKIQRGETLPLVRVRFDGSSYFLEDGFHRVEQPGDAGARHYGLGFCRARWTRWKLDSEAISNVYWLSWHGKHVSA